MIAIYHYIGINVAKLAKLPPEVLHRAKQILDHIQPEEINLNIEKTEMMIEEKKDTKYEQMLAHVDVNKMTPIEALLFLQQLKNT